MDELVKDITTVVGDSSDRFFTQRQRQLNIDMILNAIDDKVDFDFQTMLYAYADLANSVFVNGLVAEASSEVEALQVKNRIARAANSILDAIEASNTANGSEDFAALTTVILTLLDHMLKSQKAEVEALKQSTQ